MPQSCEILDRVKPFGNARALERAREQANDRRAAARVPAVRETARTDPDAPLTEEQAEAVATDEDVTLVLAGAGTGKTAVITGKVAHLVRNEGVPPSRILVLAFNRDAAKEIRARLPDDLADATVSTFHAFGRRVTADTEGTAPTISRLATDRQALAGAVDGILDDLLREPGQSNAVVEFIAYHRAPYRSPFAFRTPGEYHEYVRNHELRALSGDLVKSFEEMEIANFLSLHGIRFEYEPQYPEPTATREHRQYKPDFYLPDHEIHIEHFALDEAGDPPPGWARYAEGVEWKRGIHKQYGTRLIETCSWQREKDTLRRHLRTSLEAEGVAVRHVSLQTLVERLARSLSSSQLARLLTTFLQHVKTSGASAGELRARSRALVVGLPLRRQRRAAGTELRPAPRTRARTDTEPDLPFRGRHPASIHRLRAAQSCPDATAPARRTQQAGRRRHYRGRRRARAGARDRGPSGTGRRETGALRRRCWSSGVIATAKTHSRTLGDPDGCVWSSAPCTARRDGRRTTPSCSTSRTNGAGFRRRSKTIRCWNWCCPRRRERRIRTLKNAAFCTWR